MIPLGEINIGNLNYSVDANGMLPKVSDFNNIVIKMDKVETQYISKISVMPKTPAKYKPTSCMLMGNARYIFLFTNVPGLIPWQP